MKAYKSPKISVEDYIKQEIKSGVKYEYHDGEIFALAGGSINHGLLCGNIYSEIRNGLRKKGSPCKTVTSELKLFIESKNSYVYPDAMVLCEKFEVSDIERQALTNPTLIVEVLSKSTSDYDRGDKFYIYRQIPSLQEYVLIEQDKTVVEVYYKKPEIDLWKISRFIGLDSVIKLQSIELEVKMSDLYFDVTGLNEVI